MKVLIQKNIKFVCIDDRFYRGENTAYEFIKSILKEEKYCKKIMKEYFNKNLIMSEEEEHLFQKKVIVVGFVKNLLIMMKKKLEIIVT